jgi:O-antigen ligase
MLLGLFAVGIFATFTRSVWLSMIVGLALALWLPATIRRRGALLIAGTTAAALFVAFFADNINAFKRDKNVTEAEMSESVQLRPLLAQVAWQMFLDRPVLGHGFGQYLQAKRLYHQQVSNEPLKKVLPYMQHNVVLSYLTETGGVGTALLLTIFALMGATAFRLYSRAPAGSHRKEIGLLSLVVLAAYFINGMFHDVSIMPMVGSLFYFLLGLTNQLESTKAATGET